MYGDENMRAFLKKGNTNYAERITIGEFLLVYILDYAYAFF